MPKTDHNPAKMKKAAQQYFEEHGSRLVSKSNVKGLISAMGLRMDGEFPAEVAKKIVQDIFKAAMRSIDNKRSTIRPSDL